MIINSLLKIGIEKLQINWAKYVILILLKS